MIIGEYFFEKLNFMMDTEIVGINFHINEQPYRYL